VNTFPIKILSHKKSDQAAQPNCYGTDTYQWLSNHEYHNYLPPGECNPWKTLAFTDDIDQIFTSSPGKYSQYSVRLDEYDDTKDGYYLIHYGNAYYTMDNSGMRFLTPEIIDKCNRGSIKLLIVFVYETFDKEINISQWSSNFFQVLTQAGITRANSVVILTSTAVVDQYITDQRCKFIYYPWFELRFQLHMKNKLWYHIRTIPQAGDFSKKTKHFINLNLGMRRHRFLMILYLMKQQVDRYGHISWLNPDNLSWREIINGQDQHELAEYSGKYGFYYFIKIVNVLRTIPLDYITSTTGQVNPWLGASEFYQSAWVDLVSETYFENHGDVFLTEKTFKPIVYGLPFIFNASQNHLRCVKQLGYVSFPELFDEHYDTMPYSIEKIAEIGNQISTFCRDPEKVDLIKNSTEIHDKLAYNQNLFLNKNHAEAVGKLLYDAWNS
jgi:hypothetical protein